MAAMALAVGDRAIRPLTAEEAMAMVAAGIIGEDDPVELLHGVLTAVSPQHAPHATVTQRLTTWLAPLMVAGTHDVRVQLPFLVPDPTSLPEPDIAVVERDDGTIDHPREALLIVEVADSSMRVDTTIKSALYADAGVPEYWVVDVNARRILVHRDPADGGYATRSAHGSGEQVRPAALDVAPLEITALLRGLADG
jgi:Uma2 family endonuclease